MIRIGGKDIPTGSPPRMKTICPGQNGSLFGLDEDGRVWHLRYLRLDPVEPCHVGPVIMAWVPGPTVRINEEPPA